MRKAGIEAFEFLSARDPEGGSNIALIELVALISTHARQQRAWLCSTSEQEVVFSYRVAQPMYSVFTAMIFLLMDSCPGLCRADTGTSAVKH